MFVPQFARVAVIVGILAIANGCSHCGHHKHGVMDCLVGGRCNDCHSGCDSDCGHGHHRWRHTPQFGGEVYQDCGCGERYHGDWKSHPPCADPCDCHGNHIGCANPCQDCTHLNRGRYCGSRALSKVSSTVATSATKAVPLAPAVVVPRAIVPLRLHHVRPLSCNESRTDSFRKRRSHERRFLLTQFILESHLLARGGDLPR